MNIYELIDTRMSVRKYTEDAVPEETLRRIIEAARRAPSAANYQPWHLFVVRDAEVRRRMFPQERQQWIANAPVLLVVCSNPGKAWVRAYDQKNHADIDVAIAMEHLVLAATEEGLGSCWICAFDPARVREALQLPDGLEPVAMTPLGYSAAEPRQSDRKSLDELVTWM